MTKDLLASVALVTAGALCEHTGPTERVASPHLRPPQSSVGFSSALRQYRDTCPAPLLGFRVSNKDKVRKGLEHGGKVKSLPVPSALFASPRHAEPRHGLG